MNNSLVARNQALAVVPNGRFAEGGGLFVDGGSLTVRNTIVSSNSATLTSNLPVFAGGNVIDMNANSGGIHVSDGVPTTVENTAVTGNTVTATDLLGEPIAFDAGMLMGDSQLHMRNTLVTDNQVIASVATSADVGPSGTRTRTGRRRHDQQHPYQRQLGNRRTVRPVRPTRAPGSRSTTSTMTRSS